MPCPCPNIGRHFRNAITEGQRRSNRTDQERFDENGCERVRIFERREEESEQQREERLEVLRVEQIRRKAAQ